MKWFSNPRTVEELKRKYRDLTKKHHPDLGGNAEDMKGINNEYDQLFARLKNMHEGADGKSYRSKEENHERPEQFRAIIEQLVKMEGIKIEIIGSWIWVTGDTLAVKEDLKAMHFRWSKTKRAWYYHEEGYRKFSRRKYSLDEIRSIYGTETVENDVARRPSIAG